ncbi:MAG: transposase [Synergistaceae bacterium]|nr:transposase [Synergistaceae bacterium]
MNKSILDQGWSEFRRSGRPSAAEVRKTGSGRRQIEYKQMWRGGKVIAIEPQYTSQKCSRCGNKHADNRKTQSEFVCVMCGHEENADMNAAKNILAAGRAVLV